MRHHSRKRQKILDCLRSTTTHPTAAWIYNQLRDDIPGLSLGTVYRNLGQLKEHGFIRSMGVVAGYEHFDGNAEFHPHAVCRVCGAIIDLPPDPFACALKGAAQSAPGFVIDEVQFSGICNACRIQTPNPNDHHKL